MTKKRKIDCGSACYWCKLDVPRYDALCLEEDCGNVIEICLSCMNKEKLRCEQHQKQFEKNVVESNGLEASP